MHPAALAPVRDSWALLAPRAAAVAADFYARFVAIAPDAAPLFAHVDPAAQHRKFADTLVALVRVAEDPAALVNEGALHGRRHARYGATDAHYDAARAALLQALEAALGDDFTPATREGWTELYALVTAVMRRAATTAAVTPRAQGAAARPVVSPTRTE